MRNSISDFEMKKSRHLDMKTLLLEDRMMYEEEIKVLKSIVNEQREELKNVKTDPDDEFWEHQDISQNVEKETNFEVGIWRSEIEEEKRKFLNKFSLQNVFSQW